MMDAATKKQYDREASALRAQLARAEDTIADLRRQLAHANTWRDSAIVDGNEARAEAAALRRQLEQVQAERQEFRTAFGLADAAVAELQTEAADLRRQLATARGEWMSVEKALPDNNVRVLAVLATPRPIAIIAWYVRARALSANDANFDPYDDDDASSDYDEDTGTHYVPVGWYEDCESGNIYYRVSDAVTHWLPLPDMPPPSE